MNLSIITQSFPIDLETYNEIKTLCESAILSDNYNYSSVLSLQDSLNFHVKGFFVLAYDNEQDQLVGVASATDQMGLNTYEWSILVAPMYRDIGLDEALLKVIGDGLHQRGAEGELALVIENDTPRRRFVEKYGYSYSFSEATLEAHPEEMDSLESIHIRPYLEATDQEALIEIFGNAFGDLREESIELIHYNTMSEGRVLWVAEMDGEIVGTVTSSKEGNAQSISALAVHPDKQGLGVGTALLNWVKDFAMRNGDSIVMLDVELENERALAVYEKAGFIKSMQVDYFVYTGE
ncbi:GNAT family N-acetyltransferase [Lysinibacillus sp. SGAir0095]|uniref:GNAT family N-acetyltransferase n=1 Tax=Lysinibacillus sp. SGAir0095 TaxID=2070463 RepID=UPI0010CCBAA8|nr:GNAT family N-acetyltransferase [Lysinibacillus sp. SGAir0095]QCR30944.1 GNAT family N-acetyltransferase [Lysinibacillus sp. SGAir0095]